VIVKEHWGGSGFANTDLDFLLKQHGIDTLVIVGMLANTCIETTGKFAAELGYHVTLVRDATAAFSAEAMHAAHEINGPTYAHSIVTTQELLTALG
jgi:nicotinamidase-related amidase